MKLNILITLSILISTTLLAQENIPFEKKYFPNKSDELSLIKDGIKQANKFYSEGPSFFNQALSLYQKACEFNPNNAEINFKLADCYLFSGTKAKSLSHFIQAQKLDPKLSDEYDYYIGYAYHLNSKFNEAIVHYLKAKMTLPKESEFRQLVDKKILECNNALELDKKPIRVFIDNLGSTVNSSYPDYGPVITADEDAMYFTSRRSGGISDEIDPERNQYFEDVYVSYSFNGTFNKSLNLKEPINSKEHDAVVGLSPDGSQLITYKGKSNNGDLFISKLEGTNWTKPVSLGKPINSSAHEPSASISFDGKTMYFVSDREGGYGKHDIYMATLGKNGKWENAVSLGVQVNTQYNEDGVFIMPDNKTLYFSSEGHQSIGGYDIFKTVFENGKWSTPQNIGMPVNTPDDDVFFALSASGRNAYYVSAMDGGFGFADIYKVILLGPEKKVSLLNEDNLIASIENPIQEIKEVKEVEIKSPALTILKGIISDDATKLPIEANIDLIDNVKNEIVATFTSNSSSGKYLVSLPAGKNYGIVVKKENYLFHSENFDIANSNSYQEVVKNIGLKKIDIGKAIVLRNIFFDFNKSSIRAESASELERLINLLNENPSLKIELGSHTDNKGSDEYNLKLSESRSNSVVEYLISKGISAARLTSKGYGESISISSNDTEIGRQENRRTEFKITGK